MNMRYCFDLVESQILRLCALATVLVFSSAAAVRADAPDATPGRFGGLYKVVSSNDPIMPATPARAYFLDFGHGIRADKLSGSVAVSVRENPSLKVRIMAWQYFPEQGELLIGNPIAEGSRSVIARGAWRMTGVSTGVLLKRGSYQIILRRAVGHDD